jgi:hypothetical protein
MANFHSDEWIAVCRLKALLGEPIGNYIGKYKNTEHIYKNYLWKTEEEYYD